MRLVYLTVLGLALVAGPALAGKYNKKLSLGDEAPAWVDLPGVDGKKHSLADLAGKDVVVVVIFCNSCPVAQSYEERLIALTKKYASQPDSKVAVVAINPHNGDEDRFSKMESRAKEKGFNFLYLHDTSQEVAKKLGATVTPEFFVLDRARKVVYMGAMDDDLRAAKAFENYVAPAVVAALKGKKPETQETRPIGCAIEYKRR